MTEPERKPDPDTELNQLMVRYQQAEESAAAALIEQVSPKLYRCLASSGYSRNHVDDLLQECWLRIHRARHSYRPEEPVLPWIFAIARNTRVDGLRRRLRIEKREMVLDDYREATIGFEDRSVAGTVDFERLLEELPESQREVVTMLKVSGMSLEEVARTTQSTVGAVKQKAHRAYEKLRKVLNARAAEGGAQ